MTNEELWKDYKKNRNQQAKDQLIISYVSLVKAIAGRLYHQYNSNIEYEDLLSYGIIGLIDAIEKFDYKKEVKFETYANIRIRGAIVDELRRLDWVPRSVRQKYKKLESAISSLESQLGHAASDDQIAEHLGISLDEYANLLNEVTSYAVMSLEEKIEESIHFDIPSSEKQFNPEDQLMTEETKKILAQAIDQLPAKEKQVMALYYYSELTYKEIALIIEVSESRVSQIHTKAVGRLKHSLSDFL